MDRLLRGRVWVVGDHISTDHILPGRYLDRSDDEAWQYVLTGVAEDFPQRIRKGDILVAGIHFGCGSSREGAPVALRRAGFAAVIARSFSPIFLRNAINTGLPAVVVPNLQGFQDEDVAEIDLDQRTVRNVSRPGAPMAIANLGGVSRQILEAGGILNVVKARRMGTGFAAAGQ